MTWVLLRMMEEGGMAGANEEGHLPTPTTGGGASPAFPWQVRTGRPGPGEGNDGRFHR